jgi:hypothetical protein
MSAEIEDPFHALFFSRIPADVARSFSPAQLDAVKRAFGARSPGVHAVDLRFSLPIGRRAWYVVFLAGRERRSSDRTIMERLFRPLWTGANVLVLAAFALTFALALATMLYVGKRALNIDVFPGIDMLPDRSIERVLN